MLILKQKCVGYLCLLNLFTGVTLAKDYTLTVVRCENDDGTSFNLRMSSSSQSFVAEVKGGKAHYILKFKEGESGDFLVRPSLDQYDDFYGNGNIYDPNSNEFKVSRDVNKNAICVERFNIMEGKMGHDRHIVSKAAEYNFYNCHSELWDVE